MKPLSLSSFLFLGSVALFAGCDSGPDYHEYPGLLDLEAVTVADLRLTVPVPGRYNVTGTAVDVTTCFCPPDALCAPCLYPDGIVISETGEPLPAEGYAAADSSYLLVAAEDPEQLRMGQRYALSVEVEEGYTHRPVSIAQLLGYERAE